MTKKPEHTIILIREVWYKSLVSDLGTFVAVVGIIGTGWFLDSNAMQWCGFAMLLVSLLAVASAKKNHYTLEGAKAKLAEIERGDTTTH